MKRAGTCWTDLPFSTSSQASAGTWPECHKKQLPKKDLWNLAFNISQHFCLPDCIFQLQNSNLMKCSILLLIKNIYCRWVLKSQQINSLPVWLSVCANKASNWESSKRSMQGRKRETWMALKVWSFLPGCKHPRTCNDTKIWSGGLRWSTIVWSKPFGSKMFEHHVLLSDQS